MLDLTKMELPETIIVDGGSFHLKTDFRFFLIAARLLKRGNLKANDFDFIYKNKIPENKLAGIEAIIQFMYPPAALPRSNGKDEEPQVQIVDYDADSDLIYSAFWQQYKIDLYSVNLHWYKFYALFQGLIDTKLNKIYEFRSWKDKGGSDPTAVYYRERKAEWALEDPESPEEKAEKEKALQDFDDWLAGKRK